ncbi:MAG: hypothetical protein WCF44_14980 [Candidatus Methylophosphatis roskildensis]
MIRNGDQIRLTADEKAFLQRLAQEPVNPQTVEGYNAWIDRGIADFSEDDPEERLYKRALGGMKING